MTPERAHATPHSASSSVPAPARLGADAAGASMVFGMRLLLAVSALLTLYIAPDEVGEQTRLAWIVFFAYALHSVALFVAAQRRHPFWHGKSVYWLDVCWYALMIFCTGGGNSFFFPFFFFVILTAAFQWGFDEGARITLGSALALAAATLAADIHTSQAHLLLRTTFVLGLGYMIAYWGGLGLAQRRRLALLRDVSRLSNPRFGVDQTIASVLQQTRRFYQADNCVLLMRDIGSDQWLLHSATAQNKGERPSTISRLGAAAAAPLLAFGARETVLYARELHWRLPRTRECRALDLTTQRWSVLPDQACEQPADLLDAMSFISAPLPLRQGEGRIYLAAQHHRFSRADASFLYHLAAQVFPVIENIELLDRLASEAAFRERQKIARDLHDTTIQPYIGLRHGLSAARQLVADGDPAAPALDKLIAMATQTIGDMRSFARSVRADSPPSETELLIALRRQANQVQEFYGVEITLTHSQELDISDRLAAEVFQIVNEGMSNIRKHTRARHGLVELMREGDRLHIRIENENPDHKPCDFQPGSITERSMALGGSTQVTNTAHGTTAVLVSIPV